MSHRLSNVVTEQSLATTIADIIRLGELEDEAVAAVICDNLSRETLWNLADDLRRLDAGEKPIGGLIKRLDQQISSAQLRRKELECSL